VATGTEQDQARQEGSLVGSPDEGLAVTPCGVALLCPQQVMCEAAAPRTSEAPPEALAARYLLPSVLRVPYLTWHLILLGSHVL